jgi:uncharacterized spore protein YtfJ
VDVDQLVQRVGEHLAVGRAFGPSYEHDGTLVIPVAVVAGGGGGGADPREENLGGGFGGLIHPLGVYVVKEGQVRFLPNFDATVLTIGMLLLIRLLIKRSGRKRRSGV